MRLKKYRLPRTKKKYNAEDCLFKILINPKTPTHFYVGKIEDRSESEIEKWFGLHYAIGDDEKGYTLWCLDGGCWDRPTMHGVYEDFTGVIGRVFENTATTPSHNLNKYLLSGETLKSFELVK